MNNLDTGGFWELSKGNFYNEETRLTQSYREAVAEAEIGEMGKGAGMQASAETCILYWFSLAI